MKEFHYGFEITRKIVFEVSYYTLGNNKDPYFTTSASEFNQPKTDYCQAGQAQKALLPLNSVARDFYEKWDKKHLHDLNEDEYVEVCNDIEKLKETYNYIVKEKDTFAGTNSGLSFYSLKNLSMEKLKKVK